MSSVRLTGTQVLSGEDILLCKRREKQGKSRYCFLLLSAGGPAEFLQMADSFASLHNPVAFFLFVWSLGKRATFSN